MPSCFRSTRASLRGRSRDLLHPRTQILHSNHRSPVGNRVQGSLPVPVAFPPGDRSQTYRTSLRTPADPDSLPDPFRAFFGQQPLGQQSSGQQTLRQGDTQYLPPEPAGPSGAQDMSPRRQTGRYVPKGPIEPRTPAAGDSASRPMQASPAQENGDDDEDDDDGPLVVGPGGASRHTGGRVPSGANELRMPAGPDSEPPPLQAFSGQGETANVPAPPETNQEGTLIFSGKVFSGQKAVADLTLLLGAKSLNFQGGEVHVDSPRLGRVGSNVALARSGDLVIAGFPAIDEQQGRPTYSCAAPCVSIRRASRRKR